jgi:hypothetical protein
MKLGSIIFVVLIAAFLLLPIISGYTSIPQSMAPSDVGDSFAGLIDYWVTAFKKILYSGSIEVTYHSILGNEVNLYIDGELRGTVLPNTNTTFDFIKTGKHTIEIRDTRGNILDSREIEVGFRETKTVELSYMAPAR